MENIEKYAEERNKMIDKKLTDEKIIKRLEYMRKNADEGYMAHLENGGEVDKNEEEYIDILCGTLDFINRQKSEIERLQKEVNLVSIQFQDIQERQEESQAEIERLKGSTIVNNIMESLRIKREAKADACKECIEKVKNYIKTHCNPYGKPDFDYDTSIKILNFIDNLKKELVGEDNV